MVDTTITYDVNITKYDILSIKDTIPKKIYIYKY